MTSRDIRKNYHLLLNTSEWYSFSKEIINDRGQCFECGETENLQLHHKGYKEGHMPWEYDESEVEVLCRPCHEHKHLLADELWNVALRHLRLWEIYEVKKQIEQSENIGVRGFNFRAILNNLQK